jgi:tripartite-type tricarboxylate transporter receptor subunit TctC
VLAVSTAKRFAAVPEVPTVAELGYPGYEVATWYGVLGRRDFRRRSATA